MKKSMMRKKSKFDNFSIDPIFDLVKLAFNKQHRADAKCPSEISDVFIHTHTHAHTINSRTIF